MPEFYTLFPREIFSRFFCMGVGANAPCSPCPTPMFLEWWGYVSYLCNLSDQIRTACQRACTLNDCQRPYLIDRDPSTAAWMSSRSRSTSRSTAESRSSRTWSFISDDVEPRLSHRRWMRPPSAALFITDELGGLHEIPVAVASVLSPITRHPPRTR